MNVLSSTFLGENTYVAYPHANAFCADGETFILGRMGAASGLIRLRLNAPEPVPLASTGSPAHGESAVWYDVALRSPRLAAIFDNAAWMLDLERPGSWDRVYAPQGAARLQGLPSLSADGGKLLCGEDREGAHAVVEIDLESRLSRVLFEKEWHANHFHYCPHDEGWIAFSHEGPAEIVADRCWAWHARHAPQGKPVFPQHSEAPGRPLCVGHERWCFHDASGYAVAYAVSPVGKRGLYEVFADGREARLLFPSDILWHCDMDATGRFVVVDTTAPWGVSVETEEAFQDALRGHLRADAQRGENRSDVALIDLETREVLPLATVTRARHPYHPHPTIRPDGRWILFNDVAASGPGVWIQEIDSGGAAAPAAPVPV